MPGSASQNAPSTSNASANSQAAAMAAASRLTLFAHFFTPREQVANFYANRASSGGSAQFGELIKLHCFGALIVVSNWLE